MSRCPTCNKKPYACFCPSSAPPPLLLPIASFWQQADGVFELVNTDRGDRLVRRSQMFRPTGLSPSGHLLEVPPQWNGEEEIAA